MPNHVVNIIRIDLPDAKMILDSVLSKTEKEKELYLDFEKVIPMPEELRITSDGHVGVFENEFSLRRTRDDIFSPLFEADDKTFENFIQGLRNKRKHGYATWYSWSVAKWGTKWNSYEAVLQAENQLRFETAWTPPFPVLAKLSETYCGLKVKHWYADEDIGRNLGYGTFENGAHQPYPFTEEDYSEKAKELATYIWEKGIPDDFAL